MALIWRWPCSLFFIIQMYLMMVLMAVFFTPWALLDRAGVFARVHCYCRWVRWTAAWMVDLCSEVRGPVPQGEALIASKHQSFFDIILICSVTPRPSSPVASWRPSTKHAKARSSGTGTRSHFHSAVRRSLAMSRLARCPSRSRSRSSLRSFHSMLRHGYTELGCRRRILTGA